MFALERHKIILDQLQASGSVSVSKLAAELNVTEETIRRDLEKLEKQELLLRTHGGAVSMDDSTLDFSLEKRKSTNSEIKDKLAREAVKHIFPGDTVFLDASTTTFFMAKHLKKISGITIITNSLLVINELSGCDNIRLIAIGGQVNSNLSFVGGVAEKTIEEHYYATKVFFSSKGINETAGILESIEQECDIKRRMIENSKTKYYLCDKSKFGKIGFVKLASLETLDYFITDSDLDEQYREKLAEFKVEVIKV